MPPKGPVSTEPALEAEAETSPPSAEAILQSIDFKTIKIPHHTQPGLASLLYIELNATQKAFLQLRDAGIEMTLEHAQILAERLFNEAQANGAQLDALKSEWPEIVAKNYWKIRILPNPEVTIDQFTKAMALKSVTQQLPHTTQLNQQAHATAANVLRVNVPPQYRQSMAKYISGYIHGYQYYTEVFGNPQSFFHFLIAEVITIINSKKFNPMDAFLNADEVKQSAITEFSETYGPLLLRYASIPGLLSGITASNTVEEIISIFCDTVIRNMLPLGASA